MHWNLEFNVPNGSLGHIDFSICAISTFKINQGQNNEHNMHLEKMDKMKMNSLDLLASKIQICPIESL